MMGFAALNPSYEGYEGILSTVVTACPAFAGHDTE